MLVLAINFKVYPTAYGKRCIEIARAADKVAREYSGVVRVIVAPPHTEIVRVVEAVEEAIVYAQHVDPVPPGAYTGSVTAEAIREAGAKGSLVNHSERRLRFDEIEVVVERLRENGLEQLVCADTPRAAAAVSIFNPTYVAVEPPELIGTGVAVSRAKPEVVTRAVEMVSRVSSTPVLVGAGIVSGEDAKRAVELGAKGVLVASAVMKAQDPLAKIMELAEGLVKGAGG